MQEEFLLYLVILPSLISKADYSNIIIAFQTNVNKENNFYCSTQRERMRDCCLTPIQLYISKNKLYLVRW
jgi:hypothetical protein